MTLNTVKGKVLSTMIFTVSLTYKAPNNVTIKTNRMLSITSWMVPVWSLLCILTSGFYQKFLENLLKSHTVLSTIGDINMIKTQSLFQRHSLSPFARGGGGWWWRVADKKANWNEVHGERSKALWGSRQTTDYFQMQGPISTVITTLPWKTSNLLLFSR